MVVKLGADGIYTTGGASEFYAVEIDEFRLMIDALAEATRDLDIPTQAGCTWFNTAGAIERVEYAREKAEECTEIYRLCGEGKWDQAMKLQWRINEFYHRAPYEDAYPDAVWDKALASVCGFFDVDRTTRAPHIPMPEAQALELKAFVEEWRRLGA